MHQICNTGSFTDKEENVVLLSVIVRVEDHPQVQNQTVEWVSVGIMLTNDTMWVGQVVINALRDTVRNINPVSRLALKLQFELCYVNVYFVTILRILVA